MIGLFEWLEKKGAQDSRIRAVLRRSLAFPPGDYVEAYPYIEPFLKGEAGEWRRKSVYLAAGLWADHSMAAASGPLISIGKACALHKAKTDSGSMERRFIALLDADEDQLPQRLRMIVSILKEYRVDFEALLDGILRWKSENKTIQNQWARNYYRALDLDTAASESKEVLDENAR